MDTNDVGSDVKHANSERLYLKLDNETNHIYKENPVKETYNLFENGSKPAGDEKISVTEKYRSISSDVTTRRKILLTCCVYAAFSIIGAVIAQTGPALLDLQAIANVGLEEGAWLITALYIGYTLGAMLNGFLYHRCNKPTLFSLCMLGMMVAVAVVPWCRIYAVMFTSHFVIGVFQGIVDAAGNAEIVSIWTTSSQVALILLHSLFCVGGVISPLVMAPFLLKREDNLTVSSSIAVLSNETYIYNIHLDLNQTRPSSSPSSSIYIPYSMSSSACFIISLAFLVMYFFPYENSRKSDTGTPEHLESNRKVGLPKKIKITALIIMLSMMTICGGIANGFVALLSPFCVEFLGWSKTDGSFITSVVYISVVVGGLLGVAITKCLRVVVYTCIQCSIGIGAFLLLCIGTLTNSSTSVWIAAAMYGYSKSVILPLIIAWTNEKYFIVSGKISSVFFVGASAGSAINPFFLGFVMEKYSMKWFCYIFLAESTVLLLICIVSALLTRYTDRIRTSVVLEEMNLES